MYQIESEIIIRITFEAGLPRQDLAKIAYSKIALTLLKTSVL